MLDRRTNVGHTETASLYNVDSPGLQTWPGSCPKFPVRQIRILFGVLVMGLLCHAFTPNAVLLFSLNRLIIPPIPCTIERYSGVLTAELFVVDYQNRERPVIFCEADAEFGRATTREALLSTIGGLQLKTLDTRRSHTDSLKYRKDSEQTMTLHEYMKNNVLNDMPHANGLFHGNYHGAGWDKFLERYHPVFEENLDGEYDHDNDVQIRHVFGVAGMNSGTFWHKHGPAFSHTLIGRKAWFVYPRGKQPPIGSSEDMWSSVAWFWNTFGDLASEEKPQTCVVEAGEVLYVPGNFYHQTINLATYNSFLSVFAQVVLQQDNI
mmetsp:Transcript_27190/g.51519  ORF Transcript_27190/g.51519 Transcript_27190/m.51519 type:complete len:321 (+) Transcript_27190:193-1155(+)|eukprot:CAMPEP_0182501580 /NCGR_PEP_ID=MMETSP1321-20130603/11651_1 /TAXON_ID=91990 /ORGANISM="Bolidomonas sp., Strain RCC1657" /LENGTH=320 /DNA_ID=CAMNT_0024706273 /DNA_START=117 /DNA_END=1079 /DNA_ORIENTATION=-